MHDSMPLHIQGLTKRFRHKPDRRKGDTAAARSPSVAALSAVSLELSRGEIYGLVGPNGCGKSTLVRIVSTLLLPDEGRATVFGRDVVREAAVVRRLVNRVSVEASFFKKLSANENLLYAARLYGLEPEVAARRAAQILEQLGFPMRRTRESMENLSRGQQQKVAIARGLFTSPVLLLLDEPSTGLDPRSKREVQAFVRATVDDHDATVLFTTHDMEEANRICHRVGIMVGGRIVAEGAPEELRARCRDDAHPEPTLEDVFLRLTGKSLEEAEEASAVAAGAER